MSESINREIFLKKAIEKFGEKFKYDLKDYRSLGSPKIKIFCSEEDHFHESHGWFEVTPESHLKGEGGCKICQHSKGKKYFVRNKRDFIYFAQKVHGRKYDYSDFVYLNSKTKGIIKCNIPNHPDFLMHPNNHLSNGAGCKICGREKAGYQQSISKHGGENYLEKFLREAPLIHSNKFDYSKVQNLSNLKTKDIIEVICPKHGTQLVRADIHLKGHDCYSCAVDKNADLRRKDQSIFIKECKKKWKQNDDFYSLVEYKGKAYDITLNCPIHGAFTTNAGLHLQRGYGCILCSGNNKKTREEIINLSKNKHPGLYDYSQVEKEIKNNKQKITIICRLHGPFKTSAVGHYSQGYGCPKCGLLKSGVDNIKVFNNDSLRANSYCELYLAGVGEYLKIGIAEDSYKRDVKYDPFYLIEPSTRAECWCSEQYLLIKTQWMKPSNIPQNLSNWPGRNELREPHLDPIELAEYMTAVINECKNMGWQNFAKKYELPDYGFGWDPESENYL